MDLYTAIQTRKLALSRPIPDFHSTGYFKVDRPKHSHKRTVINRNVIRCYKVRPTLGNIIKTVDLNLAKDMK
jgi:hypothetical protein